MKPQNILITGAGMKGFIIVGILYELNKYNLLSKLDKFFGISVGSIICLLMVIDYSIEEIYQFIYTFDFSVIIKKKKNNNFIDDFINNYGIFKIDNLKYTIEKLLLYKNLNKNITFIELYMMTKKELIISISCLNTSEVEYCNYKNTPNYKIIDIIAISCNIPLFFSPINYNNRLYLDGGFYNNLPIDYFEKEIEKTLFISNQLNLYGIINNFQEYLFNLLISKNFFIENKNFKNKKLNIINIINKNNRSVIDFNITNDEKKKDFESGIEICNDYIKSHYYYYYYIKKNSNIIY